MASPDRTRAGGWAGVVAVGLLLAASPWLEGATSVDVPVWLPRTGAVVVTAGYAFALGVRAGGRPLLTGGVALLLSQAAVLTQVPVLLAGATVATAALGAVLGVLTTIPAAGFLTVVRECLIATAVAAGGALAARAYDARVAVERADYLVLGLALLGALALVHRLGAGFHGLGRRDVVAVLAGLVLLAVALAYGEALQAWGSPDLVEGLRDGEAAARDRLGAVPRPVEVLFGYPALAWGVCVRSRRRQGWWPCAFGAVALAGVGTSVLDPALALTETGLGLAYGVLAGLAVGYLVIRVDAVVSGSRGARGRRGERASAPRPEPRRASPLL